MEGNRPPSCVDPFVDQSDASAGANADVPNQPRRGEMALNPNKLTEKAQEVVAAAQHLAEEHHHTQLEPEHLLHALVSQEGGVVPAVLGKLGLQPAALLQELEPTLSAMG